MVPAPCCLLLESLFLFSRSYFEKLSIEPRPCMCPLQAIPQKMLVIIVKLGTVTSNMGMHHVLIILTLTFIQGHTDLNHKNNKCLIISKTIQAMPINFAVKIIQLKVYMNLTFIQGHKCVSNLTTFELAISRTIFMLVHSNLT